MPNVCVFGCSRARLLSRGAIGRTTILPRWRARSLLRHRHAGISRLFSGGAMQDEVLNLLSGRQGHFLLESGHHGDLWLDLETLCLHPERCQAVAAGLEESLDGL